MSAHAPYVPSASPKTSGAALSTRTHETPASGFAGELVEHPAEERDHPADSRRPGISWAGNGTLIAVVVVLVSLAAALVAGAPLADFGFFGLAVLAVGWQIAANRMVTAVEIVLWLWTTAPLIHRIGDWRSFASHPGAASLVAPTVCSILVGVASLRGATRLPGALLVYLVPSVVAIPVAALVGLVLNGPLPAAVSTVQWLAPIGVALAVCRGASVDRSIAGYLRYARWALPLLGGYAVVQSVVTPPWDRFWLQHAFPLAQYLGSPFGTPDSIRPWSFVNSPYFLASTLVFLIFTQVTGDRSWWRWPGIGLGVIALALTSIRAHWVTAVVVLVLLVLTRRVKLAPLVAFVGVAVGALFLFLPDAAESIADRVLSIGKLGTDVSFSERIDTYTSSLPKVLGDLQGAGMGSSATAARASGELSNDVAGDSNYIDILHTTGAAFGIVLILALFVVVVLAFLRSVWLGGVYAAWGALAASVPVGMVLGNVTSSGPGVFSLLAIAACLSAESRSGLSARRGSDGHLMPESGGGATSHRTG